LTHARAHDSRGNGRRAEAALWRATRVRMAHAWTALGRPVQVQIVLGAIGLPALVADHAQRFYTAGESGEAAALVPWIVRVVAVLALMLGLLLARVARGLFLRAPDETFLAVTPVPAGVRLSHRAMQLGLLTLPAVWLGAGAVLPLLWNGNAGLFARGFALWIAWAACAWAWIAVIAPLSPAAGRGQTVFELVVGVVPALLLLGARYAGGRVIALESPDSLWVTAGFGVLLAGAGAWTLRRGRWLEARREKTLESVRGRGDRRRRAPAHARDAAATLPRWGRGALAIAQQNALTALRSPRAGGPWAAGILLKALALGGIVAAPSTAEAAPWAAAGALALLGDALIGGAIITQMEYERPHLFFGAPVSRARRWWGTAGPALALTVGAAIALAVAALQVPHGGWTTARFILAWCGLAGASLVVTATNLALASFPHVAVAQNLFWVGLLVCLILSAVIPLFGWVVLVGFALYSFRQLRHWGPV
jgi:hypothetical protein